MGFNITFAIWFVIMLLSATAGVIGLILYDRYDGGWVALAGIGIGVAIFSLVAIIVIGGFRINFRMNESMLYAETIAEYDSLSASLSTTTDIVNTDLYLRIADYNKQVAKYREAYSSGACSWSFSGNYDWSSVPLINTSRQTNIIVAL